MVSFKEFLLMEEEKEIKNEANIVNKLNGINKTLGQLGDKKEGISTITKNKNYKQLLTYLCFIYFASNKKRFLEKNINSKDSNGDYLYGNIRKYLSGGSQNPLVNTFEEIYEKYKDELDKAAKCDDLIGVFDKNINKMTIGDSMNEISYRDKKDDLIAKINRDSLSDEDIKTLEEIENKNNINDEDIKTLEELANKEKTKPAPNPEADKANSESSKDDTNTDTDDNGKKDDAKKSDVIGAENISSNGLNIPVRELLDAAYDDDPKKIEELLAGWQEKIISKLDNILQARNNKIDKYLKEEQDLLWEGIMSKIQDFKDSRELKYRKEKNVEGITDTSHDEKYKEKIQYIIERAKEQLEGACKGINEYNISPKERKNKRIKINQIIRSLIDATYAVFDDAKKNSTRTDADQLRKIKEGERIEKDNNDFNSSFRGKDFQQKVEAKKNALVSLITSTFPKGEKEVKTIEDVAEAEIINVIKKSSPEKAVEDFYNRSVVKLGNNGLEDISIIEYLRNKKVVLPAKEVVEAELSQKQMAKKNPDIVGVIEAIKEVQKNINNYASFDKASELINNLKLIDKETDPVQKKVLLNNILKNPELRAYALPIVRSVSPYKEINTSNNQQQTNGKPTDAQQEANIDPKVQAVIQKLKEKNNGRRLNDLSGLEGYNELTQEQQEIVKKENMNLQAAVTTKACDGLPIGARRYSRAIRRRMNYALNKYM
jgi:hypothetical protein